MIITDGQLGNLVLAKKIVDNKKLEDILASAKNNDLSLADALVDKEIISEENLAKILAEFLHIDLINLSEITLDSKLVNLPEKVAQTKHYPFGLEKIISKLPSRPNQTGKP